MALNLNSGGLPGPGTTYDSDTRVVILSGTEILARGVRLTGADSRDPLNTGDVDYLRAGMVLGQNTTTGLYAPACLGVTTVASTNTGSLNTLLTVSAATAVEVVRRVGSTGTLTISGPPSAAGTVATATVTYTAVNTTTGVITVSAIGANYIAGSWIGDTDGTQIAGATGWVLIGNGSPVRVTNADDDSINVELAAPVIGGLVDSSQIINWPTDTSLIAWVKDQLNSRNGSRFTFDDAYI